LKVRLTGIGWLPVFNVIVGNVDEESETPFIPTPREADECAVVFERADVGYELGVVGDDDLAPVLDIDETAQFVRVPRSRTVGESTSPRTANTEERPSLASTRSPAQSSTGCSGPR